MSAAGSTRVFRKLVLALACCAAALLLALFGIRLEDLATGTGVVHARTSNDVRCDRAAIVEPGFVTQDRVRPVRPGDVLQPGQAFAMLRFDDAIRLSVVDGLLRSREPSLELLRDLAAQRSESITLHAPPTSRCWLVQDVPVSAGQLVHAGDRIVTLVEADPATHRAVELLVRLEIDERRAGGVQPGQQVRLHSSMHPHRLHGRALAEIERIEPATVIAADDRRVLIAWAKVVHTPFDLMLGSTVEAEILLERKRLARIILDH